MVTSQQSNLWEACQEELAGQGTNLMTAYLADGKNKFDQVGLIHSNSNTYETVRTNVMRESAMMDSSRYSRILKTTLTNDADDPDLYPVAANVMHGFAFDNPGNANCSLLTTSRFVAVQVGDKLYIKNASSPHQDDFTLYTNNGYDASNTKYTAAVADDKLFIISYNGNNGMTFILDYTAGNGIGYGFLRTDYGENVRISQVHIFNSILTQLYFGFLESGDTLVSTILRFYKSDSSGNGFYHHPVQFSGGVHFKSLLHCVMISHLNENRSEYVFGYDDNPIITMPAIRMVYKGTTDTIEVYIAMRGAEMIHCTLSKRPDHYSILSSGYTKTSGDLACMSNPHLSTLTKNFEMVYSIKGTNIVYLLDFGKRLNLGGGTKLPENQQGVYPLSTSFNDIRVLTRDEKHWTSFTFVDDDLYATSIETYGNGTSGQYAHTVWKFSYHRKAFERMAILGICGPPDAHLAPDGGMCTFGIVKEGPNGLTNRYYVLNRHTKKVYRWSDDLSLLFSDDLSKATEPDRALQPTVKLFDSGNVVVEETSTSNQLFQTRTGGASDDKFALLETGASYVLSPNGTYALERTGGKWVLNRRILNTVEFARYCKSGGTDRISKGLRWMKDRCGSLQSDGLYNGRFGNDPRCLCMDPNSLMMHLGFDELSERDQPVMEARVGCFKAQCFDNAIGILEDDMDLFSIRMSAYNCNAGSITICNTELTVGESSIGGAINMSNTCGNGGMIGGSGSDDTSGSDGGGTSGSNDGGTSDSNDGGTSISSTVGGSGSLDTGTIVGISIGAALLILIIVAFFVWYHRKPSKTNKR